MESAPTTASPQTLTVISPQNSSFSAKNADNSSNSPSIGLQEDSAMFVEKLEKKLESLSQKKINPPENSSIEPEIEIHEATTTTLEGGEDEENENLIVDGLENKESKKKKAFYLNLMKKTQQKKRRPQDSDSESDDDDDDVNDFLKVITKAGKRFLKTFCFCLFPDKHSQADMNEDGMDYIQNDDAKMELEETIMSMGASS